MNKYLSIISSDFKNLRRDPTLLLILFVPFLIVGLLRFGIPLLIEYVPSAADYYLEIVCFFALINAMFPGFIISFILLDEKDWNLFPAIKVTPVSLSGFLASRMVFMLIFSFLSSLMLLLFNNIYSISIVKAVQLSILCAMNIPIFILLITGTAKNKIEGLTIMKIANITLIIPIAIFFFESSWEYIFGIFPAFWIYAFMDYQGNQLMLFITGTIYLTGLNYLCFRYAVKII